MDGWRAASTSIKAASVQLPPPLTGVESQKPKKQVKESKGSREYYAKCARTTIPGSDGGKEGGGRWRCATEVVLGNGDFIHWTNYWGGWV